ncbi:hypothetical protein [Nocardia blacklockiae]|uniref:hypothetical protein n=1 Tax=Nocardia blacklockiae TaxID=480036 RepID=UPI0018962C1E|nr:hypothetical protein [Nocardia blacklockiae]MBF6171569.1 hypothetical protein [Nocardia blacklockiae]
MTVQEQPEIPPLDDATDIARSTEAQPGEMLADTRNWAGFVVLLFGVLAAVVAIVAGTAGQWDVATAAGVFAGIGLVVGILLIVFVDRRRGAGDETSWSKRLFARSPR